VTTGTERAALHQRDTHASVMRLHGRPAATTATFVMLINAANISEVSIGVFSGGARHYHDAAAFDHTGHHSQPSIMQRYSCCTIGWLQVNTTGG
jgi:hypothetical protein